MEDCSNCQGKGVRLGVKKGKVDPTSIFFMCPRCDNFKETDVDGAE